MSEYKSGTATSVWVPRWCREDRSCTATPPHLPDRAPRQALPGSTRWSSAHHNVILLKTAFQRPLLNRDPLHNQRETRAPNTGLELIAHTMDSHQATPRATAPYLDSFVGRNVTIIGKVSQLRGEQAVIDADGSINAHLNRVRAFRNCPDDGTARRTTPRPLPCDSSGLT